MRWEHLRVLLLSCCISVLAGAASAQTAKPGQGGLEVEPPRYGGSLEVGTVHVTINAISWDQGDWPWKFNHDAGNMNESLMAADLNQSIGRGGKYAFTAFGFLPADAIRGELAESWEWETPMRLVFHLRKGIMYPDKPGVMASREFTADDVIFAQNRMAVSPKQVGDLYAFVDVPKTVFNAVDQARLAFRVRNFTDRRYAIWGDPFYPDQVLLGAPRTYEISAAFKW